MKTTTARQAGEIPPTVLVNWRWLKPIRYQPIRSKAAPIELGGGVRNRQFSSTAFVPETTNGNHNLQHPCMHKDIFVQILGVDKHPATSQINSSKATGQEPALMISFAWVHSMKIGQKNYLDHNRVTNLDIYFGQRDRP